MLVVMLKHQSPATGSLDGLHTQPLGIPTNYDSVEPGSTSLLEMKQVTERNELGLPVLTHSSESQNKAYYP